MIDLVLVWYTMQCVTILANDYSSDGDKLCESQQLCMAMLLVTDQFLVMHILADPDSHALYPRSDDQDSVL